MLKKGIKLKDIKFCLCQQQFKGVIFMIDIQIEKSELIDVIESIVKEKVYVESDDACEFLATEVVNGLEELNSDETQANNLLGLNSELQRRSR